MPVEERAQHCPVCACAVRARRPGQALGLKLATGVRRFPGVSLSVPGRRVCGAHPTGSVMSKRATVTASSLTGTESAPFDIGAF